ncbi:MAG: NAD-dependent epimerase/dehydratase family protein, partial [Pseudomonadota bacterium]
LQSGLCDAVHILTPPDNHAELAIRALQAGMHVLVEKPVALTATEVQNIADAAKTANRRFHAGHNFLGLPSYERLKTQIARGAIGRISSAELCWNYPFAPLRSGPFGIWPLRSPQNLLLELGPHLMGAAVDLFGQVSIESVQLGHFIELPDGGARPQSWRILARAGDVELTFALSLVETVDDRALTIRGSTARARLDLAADTLVLDSENCSDLMLNPFRRQLALSWQHLHLGTGNALRQLVSLNRQSPYALSFQGMMRSVYDPVRDNRPPDARFSADSAVQVAQALDGALAKAKFAPQPTRRPGTAKPPSPTVMVVGGTGFIGRALTRALAAQGTHVRVVSRRTTGLFDDLADRVETQAVSLRDEGALQQAMSGIDTVFNLARTVDQDWDSCLQNDVAVAERIAQAALNTGVRRLIYTGTIASYDMSDPGVTITEATGFAEDMSDRNLYARSKAECERRLMALHDSRGLPVIIARPGIVLGRGGPLQHWGIGRWHGAGAVRIWGNGRNILPFVLIDDTVDALIRMAETDAIEGEDFNIVGAPLLSARDYFDAIEDLCGARIRASTGHLHLMYAADAVKHILKSRVLRRASLTRPSLTDWKSRAHLTPFDTTKARSMLDWHPESDKAAFLRRAVADANLFGF